MKQYQRLEILWLDCEGFRDGEWVDVEEVVDNYIKYGSSKMTSLGYFFMETDHEFIMARTLQYDEHGKVSRVEGVLAIPLGCILKIKKL